MKISPSALRGIGLSACFQLLAPAVSRASGPQMLWDIAPGSASGIANPGGYVPPRPVSTGGTVFFEAALPAYGPELWRSDGTAAGTAMVKDINPGTSGSRPTW